jgi:hypothetical protein
MIIIGLSLVHTHWHALGRQPINNLPGGGGGVTVWLYTRTDFQAVFAATI